MRVIVRILCAGVLAALIAGLIPNTASAYRASLVLDADTGVILHADKPNLRSFPASITKMMTVYLAFEALKSGKLKLDEDLPISVRAASQTGQSLRLRQGSTIKTRDAILGTIIESANDAAVVLAERLGGTESDFAELMSRKARALGMTRSEFRNASGLNHPEQVVTARDMALLALALLRNFPDQYSYFSTRSFSHRGSTFNSVNGFLVNYKGADGIKTGFTCAAGYNLVASAVRDGRRIVAVVLGETSRGGRAGTIAHLMDTAYAMPDPKPPVTIHDIDPARTHEPDLPAIGVISPTCGTIRLRSRVAQSTHRPKARSLEHRVRRDLQHQGQGGRCRPQADAQPRRRPGRRHDDDHRARQEIPPDHPQHGRTAGDIRL